MGPPCGRDWRRKYRQREQNVDGEEDEEEDGGGWEEQSGGGEGDGQAVGGGGGDEMRRIDLLAFKLGALRPTASTIAALITSRNSAGPGAAVNSPQPGVPIPPHTT